MPGRSRKHLRTVPAHDPHQQYHLGGGGAGGSGAPPPQAQAQMQSHSLSHAHSQSQLSQSHPGGAHGQFQSHLLAQTDPYRQNILRQLWDTTVGEFQNANVPQMHYMEDGGGLIANHIMDQYGSSFPWLSSDLLYAFVFRMNTGHGHGHGNTNINNNNNTVPPGATMQQQLQQHQQQQQQVQFDSTPPLSLLPQTQAQQQFHQHNYQLSLTAQQHQQQQHQQQHQHQHQHQHTNNETNIAALPPWDGGQDHQQDADADIMDALVQEHMNIEEQPQTQNGESDGDGGDDESQAEDEESDEEEEDNINQDQGDDNSESENEKEEKEEEEHPLPALAPPKAKKPKKSSRPRKTPVEVGPDGSIIKKKRKPASQANRVPFPHRPKAAKANLMPPPPGPATPEYDRMGPLRHLTYVQSTRGHLTKGEIAQKQTQNENEQGVSGDGDAPEGGGESLNLLSTTAVTTAAEGDGAEKEKDNDVADADATPKKIRYTKKQVIEKKIAIEEENALAFMRPEDWTNTQDMVDAITLLLKEHYPQLLLLNQTDEEDAEDSICGLRGVKLLKRRSDHAEAETLALARADCPKLWTDQDDENAAKKRLERVMQLAAVMHESVETQLKMRGAPKDSRKKAKTLEQQLPPSFYESLVAGKRPIKAEIAETETTPLQLSQATKKEEPSDADTEYEEEEEEEEAEEDGIESSGTKKKKKTPTPPPTTTRGRGRPPNKSTGSSTTPAKKRGTSAPQASPEEATPPIISPSGRTRSKRGGPAKEDTRTAKKRSKSLPRTKTKVKVQQTEEEEEDNDPEEEGEGETTDTPLRKRRRRPKRYCCIPGCSNNDLCSMMTALIKHPPPLRARASRQSQMTHYRKLYLRRQMLHRLGYCDEEGKAVIPTQQESNVEFEPMQPRDTFLQRWQTKQLQQTHKPLSTLDLRYCSEHPFETIRKQVTIPILDEAQEKVVEEVTETLTFRAMIVDTEHPENNNRNISNLKNKNNNDDDGSKEEEGADADAEQDGNVDDGEATDVEENDQTVEEAVMAASQKEKELQKDGGIVQEEGSPPAKKDDEEVTGDAPLRAIPALLDADADLMDVEVGVTKNTHTPEKEKQKEVPVAEAKEEEEAEAGNEDSVIITPHEARKRRRVKIVAREDESSLMLVATSTEEKKHGELAATPGPPKRVRKKTKIIRGPRDAAPSIQLTDLTPELVQQRTGFVDVLQMLTFVAILSAGDMEELCFKTTTTLTWLEEWIFLMEYIYGRTCLTWNKLCDAHNLRHKSLRPLLKAKVATATRARRRWPLHVSMEEDKLLRGTNHNSNPLWDEQIFDPVGGKKKANNNMRLVLHDNLKMDMTKPTKEDIQKLLFHQSEFNGDGSCVAKGGVTVQPCGWIGTLELFCGGLTDTKYIQATNLLEDQQRAVNDERMSTRGGGGDAIITPPKYEPFVNIFGRGYQCFDRNESLESYSHGGQLCLQPFMSSSSNNKNTSIASTFLSLRQLDVLDNCQTHASRLMRKLSKRVTLGCQSQTYDFHAMSDIWLVFGFQLNFMDTKFLEDKAAAMDGDDGQF
jgi:hypothetical protein